MDDGLSVPVESMYEDLPLPSYATAGSSGLDLLAAVSGEPAINPGCRAAIPTGLRIALPSGFEGQVRPRSGLASSLGVTVLNAPGTIDSDYRGEISVLLINLGEQAVSIRRGDRIAQLVVARVTRVVWDLETPLDGTHRGSGGFGSTGLA